MKIEDLTMSFGTRTLYENVNINIDKYDHIGVVGDNGAGKSTLFKIINKEIIADKGIIKLDNDNIFLLPQVIEDDNDDKTVYEYLEEGRDIKRLQKELTICYNKLSVCSEKEYNKIYKRINIIEDKLNYYDVYEADGILLKIIENMSINIDILDKKLKDLSGGNKSQIAFAKALYSKAGILLLDEPTNHLDDRCRNYVIEYLKHYKGILLIISHDIEFLNEVTNKTLYLDKNNKTITLYNGSYTEFKKVLTKKEEDIKKRQQLELKEEKRLEEFINKYASTSGKRKKMVKDREKKLDKLKDNMDSNIIENNYTHIKVDIKRKGNDVPININNISFKYDILSKNNIINNLTLQISRGEKFLILGSNGVGKSTLLKLIIGTLKPISGNVVIGDKMDIGYYAQEHELLNKDKSIIDNFNDIIIDENKLRSILANFLFYNDDVYKKVSVLSPGERSRVALAKLFISGNNMLLLDEPTNHLDPETQKIIANTFKDYEGTLLVVSHNKEFINNLNIERCLILPEGKIMNYHDDILDNYIKGGI